MQDFIKPLATLIESVSAPFGVHVALTGGQLYKHGERKDVDFVLYHASREDRVDISHNEACIIGVFRGLTLCGFNQFKNYGRVTKCVYSFPDRAQKLSIDFLYPEYAHQGEYGVDQDGLVDYNIAFPEILTFL